MCLKILKRNLSYYIIHQLLTVIEVKSLSFHISLLFSAHSNLYQKTRLGFLLFHSSELISVQICLASQSIIVVRKLSIYHFSSNLYHKLINSNRYKNRRRRYTLYDDSNIHYNMRTPLIRSASFR